MHTHLNFKFQPALYSSTLVITLFNSNKKLFKAEITVQPRGNVALARIFLSSGEFDSIVSRVHLLFYNTNLEKLQWIYVLAMVQATTTFVSNLHHNMSSLLNTRGTRDLTNGCSS